VRKLKKALTALVLMFGMASFAPNVYAESLNIDYNNLLSLSPYRHLDNEGQVSSDEIIIKNTKNTTQIVSFKLSNSGLGNISLEDQSVLDNDYGEDKVAFVHLRNTETNEKYLVYGNDKVDIGILEPNESLTLEICGELNVEAPWEINDYLELNLSFSVDDYNVQSEQSEQSDVSDEAVTENTTENESVEVSDNSTSSNSTSSSSGGTSSKSEVVAEPVEEDNSENGTELDTTEDIKDVVEEDESEDTTETAVVDEDKSESTTETATEPETNETEAVTEDETAEEADESETVTEETTDAEEAEAEEESSDENSSDENSSSEESSDESSDEDVSGEADI
jgi:hypothetical protein